MREFDQNAEHVLIWLGEKADQSDLALEMIKKWSNAYYEHGGIELVTESIEDPFEARAWSGISNLLKRSWWSRLGTLQEAVLRQRVSIICSTKSISRSALYYATLAWNDLGAVMISRYVR
jgi:hypothetical protein